MKILILLLFPTLLFAGHSDPKLSPQDALNQLNSMNYKAIVAGLQNNRTIVRKFGANGVVETAWEPITTSGTYQTPTTAQALEIVSDSANDAAAGSGAQTVVVVGLGADWTEQTETVTMNGTTAVDLTNTWTRVYRMYVGRSGTYASQTGSSHASTITLRGDGAGVTWAQIDQEGGFGLGQTQIGVYSVPAGKKAYILNSIITIESNKTVNIAMFKRSNASDVTTPYEPMRLVAIQRSAAGIIELVPPAPIDGIEGPADIGFLGYVGSGTAQVSLEFQLLIEDN